MTGAYFRVKRNGKWTNVELEYLTAIERSEILSKKEPEFLLSCINTLSFCLRDIAGSGIIDEHFEVNDDEPEYLKAKGALE